VKVADLGSCKGKHSPAPYTDYISTRWYRAPECLMTDGYYNEKMDIWGFGCVLFELITKKPLFPGKDELDQIHRIHNVIGTPKPEVFDRFRSQASHMEINFPTKKGLGLDKLLPSGCPNDLKDILFKLLTYDPN
jgi:renal tumor antigen